MCQNKHGHGPTSTGDNIDCVLDVDTGVDDAHALLLALRHPKMNVLAVTTVSGNLDVEKTSAATLQVLDAADAPADLPVAVGCAAALVEPTHHCPQIHGYDSLGDLAPPLPPSSRRFVSEHAVPFLAKLLEDRIASDLPPITLIALAPLTNIGMLVRMAPDAVKRGVRRIVWMGGATTSGGNASQWGEANAVHDPEAAHIVLSSCGVPVMMYTWDVYLKVAFGVPELVGYGCCRPLVPAQGGNDQARVAEEGDNGKDSRHSPASMAVHDETKPPWTQLSTRLLLRDMKHFDVPSAYIGDAGAVAAVLCEDAVRTRHLHVAVELEGKHTRGMTVVDVRGEVFPPDLPKKAPNVHVVVEVDAKAVNSVYASAVFR